MTREEAIEILKQFKKCLADVVFDEKGSEAWQMAIQALSQELCDDAISRQAVLDGIAEWIVDGYADSEADCSHISSLVTHLPPVTQKSGEWILQPSNKEQGERDFIWWKCSECGQVIYSETEKDRREYHAFCGRCGAKMESEEV